MKKSTVGRRTKRLENNQHQTLKDIVFCLGYLQQQASKAGLSEVAEWIGVAQLAGDDATKQFSPSSKTS